MAAYGVAWVLLITALGVLLCVVAGIGDAIAAANALVLTTAGRRGEFQLLWRAGAARRQLLAMASVEALLIGGIAWLVGTAAVIPAVLGVSGGLLGFAVPPVDLTTYAVLSGVTLLIPLLTVVPTAIGTTR